MLTCTQRSTWCVDHQICETKPCGDSVDADFWDAAGSGSLFILPLKAASISSLDVCNQSEHRLPKVQSYTSLMLYWCSHPDWGCYLVVFSLSINAANMLDMHNSDQITVQSPYLQDQKSLTLCGCSVDAHFNTESIQHLLPSITVFMMIKSSWFSFWQIETRPCGIAESRNILALFALIQLELIYLGNRYVVSAIYLFINQYSQATAHHSLLIYL